MQVVFAPQQKFFAARVTGVTPRRAAVEQHGMQKSLVESAFVASRAARRARAPARPFGRAPARNREDAAALLISRSEFSPARPLPMPRARAQ
jgi:hypothetical protein